MPCNSWLRDDDTLAVLSFFFKLRNNPARFSQKKKQSQLLGGRFRWDSLRHNTHKEWPIREKAGARGGGVHKLQELCAA